jgi:hypothetical protein
MTRDHLDEGKPEPASGQAFEDRYRKWSSLRRSLRNLNDESSPFHVFEVDLDHEFSYLTGISEDVLKKATQIDYQRVASEELADLEELEQKLHQLPARESEKIPYFEILAATRGLVEAIREIPVPEEGHLGFRRVVEQAFHFLEEEYGFSVAETSPISVRYQCGSIDLELRDSPKVPEITLTVSVDLDKNSPKKTFYLDDLLYAGEHMTPIDYTRFDLSAREGIVSLIWEIAALVRKYGGSLLRGDWAAIKILAEKSEERDRKKSEELDRLYGKK